MNSKCVSWTKTLYSIVDLSWAKTWMGTPYIVHTTYAYTHAWFFLPFQVFAFLISPVYRTQWTIQCVLWKTFLGCESGIWNDTTKYARMTTNDITVGRIGELHSGGILGQWYAMLANEQTITVLDRKIGEGQSKAATRTTNAPWINGKDLNSVFIVSPDFAVRCLFHVQRARRDQGSSWFFSSLHPVLWAALKATCTLNV